MFKAIILLSRREGSSHEAFCEWWLDRHAPLARRLPGVRRLVFDVVEGEAAPFDGISELWFDDLAAFEAAYASEIGQRVAADSMAHVGCRVRLFVDERLQVGRAGQPPATT
jgi:uncharacterized protein (TIGR02118 family)